MNPPVVSSSNMMDTRWRKYEWSDSLKLSPCALVIKVRSLGINEWGDHLNIFYGDSDSVDGDLRRVRL